MAAKNKIATAPSETPMLAQGNVRVKSSEDCPMARKLFTDGGRN